MPSAVLNHCCLTSGCAWTIPGNFQVDPPDIVVSGGPSKDGSTWLWVHPRSVRGGPGTHVKSLWAFSSSVRAAYTCCSTTDYCTEVIISQLLQLFCMKLFCVFLLSMLFLFVLIFCLQSLHPIVTSLCMNSLHVQIFAQIFAWIFAQIAPKFYERLVGHLLPD